MKLLWKFQSWLRHASLDRTLRAARARNVAPNATIDPTVQVLGWQGVRIGAHSVISEHTWLNVNTRDAPSPAIVIGNHCFIGRRNFLSAGTLIQIGDYALTGVDCHFLGTDHRHDTPFAPYITTGTTEEGAIELGPNCWLGASVTVLKNVKIGFGSIVGAGSVVRRDLPPFSLAVGNPARVIRRYSPARGAWVPAADWPAEGDQDLPTEAGYLADLRTAFPSLRLPRVASGSAAGDL